MPGNRQRALIADDHHLVAEMCSKLLETEFTVVGSVQNGRAMVRAAAELKPDVIIVDVAMPVLNGLDAGGQVKGKCPLIKLVYLTMNPDPGRQSGQHCAFYLISHEHPPRSSWPTFGLRTGRR